MRERLVKELMVWFRTQLQNIHIEAYAIIVMTEDGDYLLLDGDDAKKYGK